MKNQKGITLIALIITIIVMLILVGVSVTVAINTGLFTTASGVSKNTEDQKANELKISGGQANLDGTYTDINKYVVSLKAISKKEGEPYTKYYADVDGDKKVDGVIYADLAFDGQYYDAEENEEDFKDYYVSQKDYEGFFGTADVLAPTGTGGTKERFYVMALEDVTTEDYSTFYWYYNAEEKMVKPITSRDFGTGEDNTKEIKGEWDKGEESLYGTQNAMDIWAQIGQDCKWFIASEDEWYEFYVCFQNLLDERSIIISDKYWTSSVGSVSEMPLGFYDNGGFWIVDPFNFSNALALRLSTTF